MQKRKFPASEINLIPLSILEKESLLTCWFLSYCLLVSESEKFIVRQVNPLLKEVQNPGLIAELKVCLFQETQHAISHKLFNDLHLTHRPFISAFVSLSKFINFTILEKLFPVHLRLSVASAMEQLNAEISYYGLEALPHISKEDSFQSLLGWHFVEEIEHRDHVFDLMKDRGVSKLFVALGAQLTLFSFCFWITLGSLLISARRPRLWFQFFILLGPQGILTRLSKSTGRYLKSNYHPSQEATPLQFFSWQQKVQALE
jgi:predicted metal-dependent hydrolase